MSEFNNNNQSIEVFRNNGEVSLFDINYSEFYSGKLKGVKRGNIYDYIETGNFHKGIYLDKGKTEQFITAWGEYSDEGIRTGYFYQFENDTLKVRKIDDNGDFSGFMLEYELRFPIEIAGFNTAMNFNLLDSNFREDLLIGEPGNSNLILKKITIPSPTEGPELIELSTGWDNIEFMNVETPERIATLKTKRNFTTKYSFEIEDETDWQSKLIEAMIYLHNNPEKFDTPDLEILPEFNKNLTHFEVVSSEGKFEYMLNRGFVVRIEIYRKFPEGYQTIEVVNSLIEPIEIQYSETNEIMNKVVSTVTEIAHVAKDKPQPLDFQLEHIKNFSQPEIYSLILSIIGINDSSANIQDLIGETSRTISKHVYLEYDKVKRHKYLATYELLDVNGPIIKKTIDHQVDGYILSSIEQKFMGSSLQNEVMITSTDQMMNLSKTGNPESTIRFSVAEDASYPETDDFHENNVSVSMYRKYIPGKNQLEYEYIHHDENIGALSLFDQKIKKIQYPVVQITLSPVNFGIKDSIIYVVIMPDINKVDFVNQDKAQLSYLAMTIKESHLGQIIDYVIIDKNIEDEGSDKFSYPTDIPMGDSPVVEMESDLNKSNNITINKMTKSELKDNESLSLYLRYLKKILATFNSSPFNPDFDSEEGDLIQTELYPHIKYLFNLPNETHLNEQVAEQLEFFIEELKDLLEK